MIIRKSCMKNQESNRLDLIAKNSLYAAGANAITISYSYEIFKRFFVSGSILELGPAEGLMTDKIVTLGRCVTCVDGSKLFCDSIKSRHPSIEVINSLFEDFNPSDNYDNIVLGHVEDPVAILDLVKTWLKPNGIVLAAVPNSRSLHRQAATIMGMLESENSLNSLDLHHGHRRVFNPEDFRKIFRDASLKINYFGGYWLKPISSGQIEESWSDQMLHAFMVLGERYPDIAGEIYVVASK